MNNTTERGFTSFLCPNCGTEIEASLDLIGQKTECPACGADFVVPQPDPNEDGVLRHTDDDSSPSRTQALKSRTIRIELDDL